MPANAPRQQVPANQPHALATRLFPVSFAACKMTKFHPKTGRIAGTTTKDRHLTLGSVAARLLEKHSCIGGLNRSRAEADPRVAGETSPRPPFSSAPSVFPLLISFPWLQLKQKEKGATGNRWPLFKQAMKPAKLFRPYFFFGAALYSVWPSFWMAPRSA